VKSNHSKCQAESQLEIKLVNSNKNQQLDWIIKRMMMKKWKRKRSHLS